MWGLSQEIRGEDKIKKIFLGKKSMNIKSLNMLKTMIYNIKPRFC